MSSENDNFDRENSTPKVAASYRQRKLLKRLNKTQDRRDLPAEKTTNSVTEGDAYKPAKATDTDSVPTKTASVPENVAKATKPQPVITKKKDNNQKLPKSEPKTRAAPPEPASNSDYAGGRDSTLDIYSDHFGLSQRPFSLVPDPSFLYWSSSHRRAYTMLEYGILTSAPITLITGEVGAGKTTLLQHLLKNIGDDVKVGLISNAHGSRGELLQWVLMSLDQPTPDDVSYVTLFDSFQKYLISEYALGNRVILIFDEAQNLSRETLEELRMFTNINANSDVLLQLVLVGQPELRDMVRRPDLRQFAQRVAASFHLDAMDRQTVKAYIGHRLKLAGAERKLFNNAACALVCDATGGVPRLINQLCDLSMVYAFTKGQKSVTVRTIKQVLDDGAFFGTGTQNLAAEAKK